jgi:hypothetical protein|tara:strand:+ start:3212 stop:4060 length:849 start_codon:yes stop_codon:yes gene_type:complete
MTDNEIEQYLEAIKPYYNKMNEAALASIRNRIDEIDDQIGEIDDDERRNELLQERNRLHSRQCAASYFAEKLGVEREWQKVRDMPRNEIRDIQRQAELLNILNNRAFQLQKACSLLEADDLTVGYTLSYGYIADLRGSSEDAVAAVQLSTGEGHYLLGDALDEDSARARSRDEAASDPNNSDEEQGVFVIYNGFMIQSTDNLRTMSGLLRAMETLSLWPNARDTLKKTKGKLSQIEIAVQIKKILKTKGKESDLSPNTIVRWRNAIIRANPSLKVDAPAIFG